MYTTWMCTYNDIERKGSQIRNFFGENKSFRKDRVPIWEFMYACTHSRRYQNLWNIQAALAISTAFHGTQRYRSVIIVHPLTVIQVHPGFSGGTLSQVHSVEGEIRLGFHIFSWLYNDEQPTYHFTGKFILFIEIIAAILFWVSRSKESVIFLL